jgi:hypothetical protein
LRKKGIFFITGESFRIGLQGTRVRGTSDSLEEQEMATMSQLSFFSRIKEEVDFKIKIITYSTDFDNKIREWFKEYDADISFLDNLIGYDNLYKECVSTIDLSEDIDFVFFMRIDLILKKKFLDVFILDEEKIKYPSVCWITSFLDPVTVPHHKTFKKNRHRVNDLMLYVPKKFFNELKDGEILITPHEACDFMGDYVYNNVDFFLDTYHDSDSYKDRNPIYKIANRPESNKWYSEGYTVGHDPILDNNKSYSEVFTDEEILK